MAKKYLDKNGLQYFWGKIKSYVVNKPDVHLSHLDPTSVQGNDGDLWVKYPVFEIHIYDSPIHYDTYSYDEGMTWDEWLNSSYSAGALLESDGTYVRDLDWTTYLDYERVYPSPTSNRVKVSDVVGQKDGETWTDYHI